LVKLICAGRRWMPQALLENYFLRSIRLNFSSRVRITHFSSGIPPHENTTSRNDFTLDEITREEQKRYALKAFYRSKPGFSSGMLQNKAASAQIFMNRLVSVSGLNMAWGRSNSQQRSQPPYEVKEDSTLPDPEKEESFNKLQSLVVIHFSGYHQDPTDEAGPYVVDSRHHFFGRQRRTSQVKQDSVKIFGTHHRQGLLPVSCHLTLTPQILNQDSQSFSDDRFALDQKYLAIFGSGFHGRYNVRLKVSLSTAGCAPCWGRSPRGHVPRQDSQSDKGLP
jgi:hypothetical protein